MLRFAVEMGDITTRIWVDVCFLMNGTSVLFSHASCSTGNRHSSAERCLRLVCQTTAMPALGAAFFWEN